MTTSTSRPPTDLMDQKTVEIPRFHFRAPTAGSPAPRAGFDVGGYPGAGQWATRGAGHPAGMPPMPPLPPGGYAMPPMPPNAPGGGPRGRRGAWIGGVAALLAVVALLVGVVVWNVRGDGRAVPSASATSSAAGPTTTASAPAPTSVQPAPEKTIAAGDLEQFLLTPGEIVAAIGRPGTAALAESTAPRSKLFIDDISAPECLGIAFTAEKDVYQGSGYTAAQVQTTLARRDKNSPVLWVHDEAVFSFPSPQAAADFVSASTAAWQRCAGTSWVHRGSTSAGESYQVTWSAGQVSANAGLTSVLLTREGGDGWGCRRGLTAESSVVVDVAVCGDGVPEAAITGALGAITGKIVAA